MGAKQVLRDPRLEFTRRLMKYFSRVDVREVLPIQLENGERPFLAVLVDDRVSEVCAKVALTGSANVCVEYHGSLAIMGFEPGFTGVVVEEKGVQDIHRDITVGMLLDFATTAHEQGDRIPLRIDVGTAHSRVPSMKVLAYA